MLYRSERLHISYPQTDIGMKSNISEVYRLCCRPLWELVWVSFFVFWCWHSTSVSFMSTSFLVVAFGLNCVYKLCFFFCYWRLVEIRFNFVFSGDGAWSESRLISAFWWWQGGSRFDREVTPRELSQMRKNATKNVDLCQHMQEYSRIL